MIIYFLKFLFHRNLLCLYLRIVLSGCLYFISISAYVGCIGVPYSDMDNYKILSFKKQENEK